MQLMDTWAKEQFIESLFVVLYLGFASWLIIGIVVWSITWKIAAMWKAGRADQKMWFVVLALAPTFGIIEIVYLMLYSKISRRLKAILSIILFGVIVILLSPMGSPQQQPIEDPPLSGAPYELTGTPVPKGDRILSIDVNVAEDNDFDKAVRLAQSAGMQTAALSINWDMIEAKVGLYTDPDDTLATVNAYYPTAKTRLALYLRSVDTNSKPVPADLKDTPHDDPQMAERYLKMLDWALPKLKDVEIEFLSVGDEIDVMMGQNKDLYRQFEAFFKTVKPQINAKWPNLKIGFSATLYGLTRDVPDELKRINQESDIVLVSYYPVNADLTPKEPGIVATEYDAVVKMYPERTLYIEQTGYPTSSLLGGSEAKQREFIQETFRAWDKHRDQIKYISFTWLHDLPQSTLDFYAQYYGTSDKRFMEYLRTLGFRTYAGGGEDKESFRAIKAEAKARGW